MKRHTMTAAFVFGSVLGLGLESNATAEHAGHAMSADPALNPMLINPEDVKWTVFPNGFAMSTLRVDPKTKATQLLMRMPKGGRVPLHWHSANEIHVLLSGTFIMDCGHGKETMKPGAYNFVPRRMVHEAWGTPDDGALLFISVDGEWDTNWVKDIKPGTFMPEDAPKTPSVRTAEKPAPAPKPVGASKTPAPTK